jgi:CHAD domain-containing protein
MSVLKVGESSPSERVQRAIERAARDPRARIGAGAVVAAGAAVAATKVAREAGEDGGGPSRAYRLRRKEDPAAGVRRIAYGRIDDALDHAHDHDADPVGSVHEVRKDLKKLRSLLRLVRPSIPTKIYRRENARFRDLGRELAGARDAEVKLQTLEGLREISGDLDGVEAYAAALDAERAEAGVSAADAALAVAALEGARDGVSDWSPKDGWRPPGPGFVRAYRRGRDALAAVQADPSDEAVHEWRKRSKDLWYHLRIVRRAWPQSLAPLADEAHELSDLLGDHHDLAVLADDVSSRDGRFSDGAQADLLATIRRRQAELLDDALSLGERLYAERPKAFGERLDAYWRAKKR